MTNYWDPQFLNHLSKLEYICEVGARYGDESIKLSQLFPTAKILSFECNPITVPMCYKKLQGHTNIKFFPFGLGSEEKSFPFYSYMIDNDGASSLYKRIDFNQTQRYTGDIQLRKLCDVVREEKIPFLDLLCMDVQGYELQVLKGCDDFLQKIKYIIMEEPKPIINTLFLPANCHSKYIGAPTSAEIKKFMTANNFTEIVRISENAIEDNVMYKKND